MSLIKAKLGSKKKINNISFKAYYKQIRRINTKDPINVYVILRS